MTHLGLEPIEEAHQMFQLQGVVHLVYRLQEVAVVEAVGQSVDPLQAAEAVDQDLLVEAQDRHRQEEIRKIQEI